METSEGFEEQLREIRFAFQTLSEAINRFMQTVREIMERLRSAFAQFIVTLRRRKLRAILRDKWSLPETIASFISRQCPLNWLPHLVPS